jgi:hypothetical protein
MLDFLAILLSTCGRGCSQGGKNTAGQSMEEGGEEHDRRGTLGPREEGIRRGRPEAHGRASWRGKRSIKTREEGYAITQARGLRGVVRRGRVRPARASFLPIVSAIFIFVI